MWLEEFGYTKDTLNEDDWNNAEIAECIQNAILKEFKILHFSGNLSDTLELVYSPVEHTFKLFIKAPVYDIAYFKKTGIIIPPKQKTTNNKKTWKSPNIVKHGSYAEQVNITGGFSHKHKNYVARCIKAGYEEWRAKQSPELKITISKIDG